MKMESKFFSNASSGSCADSCGETDRTKRIWGFRD